MVDDAAVIRESVDEPERFGLIFERHAPHIQRYLARRLDRNNVDDLLAQTFLVTFDKRRGYDGSRPNARPWLCGIATNMLARHRREELRAYRLSQAVPADRDDGSHADRDAAGASAAPTTT